MIEPGEFTDRMRALQRLMAITELDTVLVSAEDSIYYLTGVSYKPLERPFFIIVGRDRPATLLVPALEQAHLRAAPNVDTVHRYWDYPSPPGRGWPERLKALLEGSGRLGIEPTLPQEIAVTLDDFSPVPVALVEALRRVKSPAEVMMIRQAANYADLAVRKVIGTSYHGVREIELFSQGRAVQADILKSTHYDPLTTNVLAAAWPAPLSAQPHGVPAVGDRLGDGPHIALGLLRVNGYCAECERTYFLSSPSEAVADAFHAMVRARKKALALVRPGALCAEIDLAAKASLEDDGYGDDLLHRTGHGFGLGNHEGPWVADGSDDALVENMVISIEPGIYLPGVGGIRHSDTTLVTADGYEHLTVYPDDIDSLTIRSPRWMARLRGWMLRHALGIK